jgi:hypothetical protein
MDGFDVYNGIGANTGMNSGRWTLDSGQFPNSMVAGRFGGQAVNFIHGSFVSVISRPFPAATANLTFGFALRCSSFPGGTPTQKGHFYVKSGATFQCGILVDTGGAISVYRMSADTAGTLLGTMPAGTLVLNVFHYIEVEVVLSTTVGRVTIFVDGVQKLNLTNVNNANAGVGTTADRWCMGSTNGGNGPQLQVDDLYVTDTAARLGERKIETLYPTGDVAAVFTHNIGASNFAAVDDPQANGDTDYVQGTTLGDTDRYDFGNLASTPATIDAVQVVAFAQKTDAATRGIALQVKSGATISDGPTFNLAVGYQRFERLLTADPAGGGWATASVNALQGGPKIAL